MNEPQPPSGVQIALADFTRFIRQVSHDLRNHLNAAELQAAYIGEIAEDAEVKAEVKRLRAMVSEVGAALQKLTSSLAPAKLTEMPYRAADFTEDFRQRLTSEFPAETDAVKWDVNVEPDATLNIDPQLLQPALLELFANAFRHARGEGPVVVTAAIDDHSFVFKLLEPKSGFDLATEKWGREPLRNVNQGHYGLGLHRVRSILEAHHGQFDAHYDRASSALLTTIRLPLVASEEA